MSNHSFYKNLPVLQELDEVGHPHHYVKAPSDWHVVITDVRGSTKAIEEGRYKEVNMVGAATVAALLNIAGKTEIPFIFGGDGASFVIPPSLLASARDALHGVQKTAQSVFGMELRVGIVPVFDVEKSGEAQVLIAKLRISPHYAQAIFSGGGMSYAEKLIKDPITQAQYLVLPDPASDYPNFSGLTCRWNDIQSRHGETISLLVKASVPDEDTCDTIYRRVIKKIEELYGLEKDHHPVAFESLRIALKNSVLNLETRVRAAARGEFGKLAYLLFANISTIGFHILTKTGIDIGDINQRVYREHLIATVDYKKFDDALRLVISGTPSAREKLIEYLESERAKGLLAYGIHVSDRALMTCLVFERYGKQVHFIDGADGGYTLAAKQLKSQLGGK